MQHPATGSAGYKQLKTENEKIIDLCNDKEITVLEEGQLEQRKKGDQVQELEFKKIQDQKFELEVRNEILQDQIKKLQQNQSDQIKELESKITNLEFELEIQKLDSEGKIVKLEAKLESKYLNGKKIKIKTTS